MSRQGEIQQEIAAQLAEPCDNPADQAVRDRLVRFDRLVYKGHPAACAIGQVWNGKPCWCHVGGVQ